MKSKADWLDHFALQFTAADQGMLRSISATLRAVDAAPISEIVARMREYAPSLRGQGMTASDARFNRTLRDADTLEALALKATSERPHIPHITEDL